MIKLLNIAKESEKNEWIYKWNAKYLLVVFTFKFKKYAFGAFIAWL